MVWLLTLGGYRSVREVRPESADPAPGFLCKAVSAPGPVSVPLAQRPRLVIKPPGTEAALSSRKLRGAHYRMGAAEVFLLLQRHGRPGREDLRTALAQRLGQTMTEE